MEGASLIITDDGHDDESDLLSLSKLEEVQQSPGGQCLTVMEVP